MIIIWGEVKIRNGDKIIKANNHFVDAGLKSIMSVLMHSSIYGGPGSGSGYYWYLPTNSWHIYVGSDLVVTTVTTHTELQSPIGVSPGTGPDSKSVSVIHDGTSDGDWYITLTAIWNVGSLPPVTLGEAALYLRNPDKSSFQWVHTGSNYTPSESMTSRLSAADGDFGSIVIDDTKPLVVDWTIHFTFA